MLIGKRDGITGVHAEVTPSTATRRSVVKVEPSNMIGPCPNLKLQIVWNWLRLRVLFGRLTAIGSIYLLRTTKVCSSTETGSRTEMFLLFTVSLFLSWGFWRTNAQLGAVLLDFLFLFLVALWRWTERCLFLKSLVFYPEALCAQAWTPMILMAVFNEDIFTGRWPWWFHRSLVCLLPSAWDTKVDQKLA